MPRPVSRAASRTARQARAVPASGPIPPGRRDKAPAMPRGAALRRVTISASPANLPPLLADAASPTNGPGPEAVPSRRTVEQPRAGHHLVGVLSEVRQHLAQGVPGQLSDRSRGAGGDQRPARPRSGRQSDAALRAVHRQGCSRVDRSGFRRLRPKVYEWFAWSRPQDAFVKTHNMVRKMDAAATEFLSPLTSRPGFRWPSSRARGRVA